jgi:hypothetical protein
MKTTLLVSASLAGLVAASALAGCGNARTPEAYRDDTRAVLEKKNEDIRACYDGVLKASPGASGKLTVLFEVQEDTGQIANVSVDKTNTTAPDAIADCVTKNISGLALVPPDGHKGEGTWVYQFAPSPPQMMAPASAATPGT